ncbi:hypothetical protein GJ744_003847 [Endocarpon pusillum]|uniref:Uncharacterized protein n=1 Tax=Endocarpon pusillum TaxID=364733 RepID=A0A8H7AQH8_9EURO|nr:hypothetical protein GJ744_003847 [Endocarpon pusillum]
MPTVRRSGRQRQASKKYQNDLLEKETLRLLRESSESSRPTSPDTSDSEIVKSDDDFDTSKGEEPQVSADEADDLSLVSGSGRGLSQGSDIETPNESDENMSIATSGISRPEDYEGVKRKPGPKISRQITSDTHSRGLPHIHRHASRETFWRDLAGPEDEDVIALLFARDQWRWKRDVTFPSRKSLAETAVQGVYGDVSRFGVPAEDLRCEATDGWDWYHEDIGQSFRKRQRLEGIDDMQVQRYIACTTGQDTSIVMGPSNSQQAYHLAHLSAMDFGQAWETEPAAAKTTMVNSVPDATNSDKTSDDGHAEPTAQTTRSRYREGWLLNLGSKINCLAWAPNRHGSDIQYLAVSTGCSPLQRDSVPASNDKRAPAFRPSPPYPSSIQIWAFGCGPVHEGLQKADMTQQPMLAQVLCTNWGNIRQLQWCPVLREARDLPGQEMDASETANLGLLGIVASDGHVRVLDISVPRSTRTGAQFLLVHSAAFNATPSSAIYTCLSFASPTDLLCGTSSGSVDLFNILQPTSSPPSQNLSLSPTPTPTPYLTSLQSKTYILSLSPAYPSPFPHLLVSISTSGTPTHRPPRPYSDTLPGKSSRLANKNVVYSPHLRSYILSSEDDGILAYPVRRFFNGIRIARYSGQGSLTALATSRWHPCLLWGTASGTVSATNMVRKVLPPVKQTGGVGSGAWVQKLCEHHWVPHAAADPTSPTAESMQSTAQNGVASTPTPAPTTITTAATATNVPTTTTTEPNPLPPNSKSQPRPQPQP